MLNFLSGPHSEAIRIFICVVSLFVIKPIVYFIFIQTFRYRVSRAAPMSLRRAAGLAVVRYFMGMATFVFIGPVLQTLQIGDSVEDLLRSAWVVGIVGRVGLWSIIGREIADLRGRWFMGCVIFGVMIDIVYDLAALWTMYDFVWGNAILVLGLMAFLIPLHTTGRSDALRNRFASGPHCGKCQYNLTGNISGQCPECGEPIVSGI